jgi:hypothetical protein
MSSHEQFADVVLGIPVENDAQRYNRIVRELEAAGARMERRPDGTLYIKPGSIDSTKLGVDAVRAHDSLTSKAPGAGSVSATDREIALHIATFGEGLSEREALTELALRGDDFLQEHREKIDAHRHRLEQQAHQAERLAFEASPAGRRIAAAEAAQAEARDCELETNARALLIRDAESYGIRPEHVARLTRAEVLRASGITPDASDEQAAADRDPAANLARAVGDGKEGE